jgi:hypothetical protein
MLTPFGKAVAFTIIGLLVAILVSIVMSGTRSPDCEHLYNEYTSASDMGERANIFEKGIDNGCFHYN